MTTIDNTINWAFTLQLFLASASAIALLVLGIVCWQIWKETR